MKTQGQILQNRTPINIQNVRFNQKSELYEVTYLDKGEERILVYNKSHSIEEVRQKLAYKNLPLLAKNYIITHQGSKTQQIYKCTLRNSTVQYLIETPYQYFTFTGKGKFIDSMNK